MTSIYEFDLKSPKMFLHTKHMNFPGQGFQNITHNITHRQTDRQTDRQMWPNAVPRRIREW